MQDQGPPQTILRSQELPELTESCYTQSCLLREKGRIQVSQQNKGTERPTVLSLWSQDFPASMCNHVRRHCQPGSPSEPQRLEYLWGLPHVGMDQSINQLICQLIDSLVDHPIAHMADRSFWVT